MSTVYRRVAHRTLMALPLASGSRLCMVDGWILIPCTVSQVVTSSLQEHATSIFIPTIKMEAAGSSLWRTGNLWNAILIYIQQDATLHSLSGSCSTCFGWYHHPSSGAQTTVSTASGICHAVIAICRYRGRVGTGFSVLWVATHSTLKPESSSLLPYLEFVVATPCTYVKAASRHKGLQNKNLALRITRQRRGI